ncbi:MAG: extracellular solute-binding protein, partial [Oscillospiraceae bacterium]|nr:extracellular solute-binding protein [Oscillospiraceae bacterium]
MKRIAATLLTLSLLLIGCNAEPPAQPDPLAGWLETANLAAEETPEQLYAAAKTEGMLTVYSTSTRMMDVAESFEKEYPGLTVKVNHTREPELYELLAANYAAGDFTVDLITISDGRGVMTNEFLPKNIVAKYVPYDIADKLLPGNNDELLALAGESPILQYNDAYYSEPPVHNWWELTEDKWRGLVHMPNPSKSATTLAFLMTVMANSDLMAEGYETLYGEPLAVPEGETAGRIFIRRLVENGVVIVNSSDEAVEIVGSPGSSTPNLAVAISSKTRLREIGYRHENNYDMEPFCGVYIPINVMITGGAPNINTAKLFIRWMFGGTDGQGEGYKPYLLSGQWSVRSDVRDITDVRPEELNLLQLNKNYQYENQEAFLAFWAELMAA